MRTTTGWLDRVVRLDVDFADLLLAGDEAWDWKAGALRARRAADWVGGSVFVSVVVVLGTEPVLSCASGEGEGEGEGEGAWVTMAGTAAPGAAMAGVLLPPHSVESTPSDTDCRVVVAGVNVGGTVAAGVESAMAAEPWSVERGAEAEAEAALAGSGVSDGLLGEREFAAESGIVGIALLELQVNAWSLATLESSWGRQLVACCDRADVRCAGRGLSGAAVLPQACQPAWPSENCCADGGQKPLTPWARVARRSRFQCGAICVAS